MKPKSICLSVSLCFYFLCPAQSVQEQMTKRQPACRDVLMNASDVLSKLYAERSFDSIRAAVNIMEQFCGDLLPIAYCLFIQFSNSSSGLLLQLLLPGRLRLPMQLIKQVRLL
jgi:hypothetical protein